jgi:nucleoside-diphosphate kinase
MVKPDGYSRRLCGEVIRRFEAKGLQLVGLKMQIVSEALAAQHYAEHKGKPFYPALMAFIQSGPSIQMVWQGEHAVEVVRKINGATNSVQADVGTIRGDYGLTVQNNIVHASDSVETADREISIYFDSSELWDYTMPDAQWLGA